MKVTFRVASSKLKELKELSPDQIKELSWSARSAIQKMIDFVSEGKQQEEIFISSSSLNGGCLRINDTGNTFSLEVTTTHIPDKEAITYTSLTNFIFGIFTLLGLRPSSQKLYDQLQSINSIHANHNDL